MATPDFPNGFDSWQHTHFEVVEVLVYLRDLDNHKRSKTFAEALDQSASEGLYKLALDMTNKYEEQRRARPTTRTLFDEIEEFVHEELKDLPELP